MKVCSVFSLVLPHRVDSNDYTQHTISNIKKKITLNYPNLQLLDFFLGTRERVRDSRGKRVISLHVSAT